MKSFRKIFAAIVLTLAITVPSYPGETSFPGTRLTIRVVTPEVVPEALTLDPVTEGMLSLLQGLLLIF